MRSLRLMSALLALVLLAAACGGDDAEEAAEPVTGNGDDATTTSQAVAPTTSPPEFTLPPTTETIIEVPETTLPVIEPVPTTIAVIEPVDTSVGPPVAPANVRCTAGANAGELTVEFDALPNPTDISKIRVYVSVDGGPMITNGEFSVDEIDTNRSGSTRWAARARDVPVNTPLRVTATSFNLLGQESGWYVVPAYYTGPGQPCASGADTVPPATTCTAGCDETEGEPSP